MLRRLLLILLFATTVFASTEDNYVPVEYDCDGGTTEFTFSWPIGQTSDLEVILKLTSTEVEEVLIEDTHYDVSATNNDYSSGGTVTTLAIYANTYTLTIRRETAKSQDAILADARVLRLAAIENGLDKLTRLIQDLQEIIDRCLKIPKTETNTVDLVSIENRADKQITFGAGGDVTVTSVLSTGAASISAYGETLIDDGDAPEARDTLGLDTDDDVEFAEIIGTDVTFDEVTTDDIIASDIITDDITTKSPLIDIRAYLPAGYVTDGSVDYTTQIQLAFDDAAYKTVFIPSGVWQITSTIDVPVSCSVLGVGFNSRILATACNAFSIPISGSLGGTEWSKIQIYGDSASAAYRAFEALGNVDAGLAAGITFRKLYINKIGTAFFLRGLSYGRIVDCAINDVWYGIHIEGQVIRLQIIGNDITRDYLGTGVVTGGAGDSTGIIIDDASDYNPGGVTTKGPEDVMISHNHIAGFEVAVDIIVAQLVTIFSNDFDRQTVNGISFTQKTSNLTIRDNWIVVYGAAAMYGIQGEAGAIDPTYALIQHNMIYAHTAPHANSEGIRMGTNQDNVIVEENYIVGFQKYDIYFVANKGGIVRNNICASTDPATYSILAESLSGNEGMRIEDNICAKAVSGAIPTLDDTGTPSILYSDLWVTGGTTAITDFDDGQLGDVITVIGAHIVTITDGAHIVLDGGANMAMTVGDTLMLIQLADTKWYQLSESDNN